MTTYLGTSPSSALGRQTYYRVVFDVSGQGLFFGTSSTKLNYIYEHMQDTGALAPLTPNPVSSGDEVMTVDTLVIGGAESFSVAEAVRRLEMVAGQFFGAGQQNVRSIQKLSSIGDVTNGAGSRDDATDNAEQQNKDDSFSNKLGGFLSGVGDFATLAVIGLVAYAVLTLSAGLPLLPSRRRR